MRGAIPPLPHTSSWRGAQSDTGTPLRCTCTTFAPSPLYWLIIVLRGR